MNNNTEENKLKRSKKFAVAFLDFVTCFFLAMSLFFAGEAINTSLPYYQEETSNISRLENDLTDLVVSSKLSYIKGDGYLAQTKDMASSYILSLTYTSVDIEKRNDEMFKNVTEINEDKDNLYFYYSSYVKDNQSNFSDFSKIKTIDKYKEDLLKESKSGDNSIFVTEGYPFFTNETANEIYSFLVEGKQTSSTKYNLVYDAYSKLLEEAISQYMELFIPYVNLVNEHSSTLDHFYQVKIGILLGCFFISILIIYFLIPVCLKDGRTLFMKIFRLKAISVDEGKITWPFNLLRAISLFFIYLFSTSLIALIVLGGYNGLITIYTVFLGIFNLLFLSVLSILLTICSMLFTFFRKNKKQTFSEFISLMIVKEDDSKKTITVGDKTFEIQ